MTQAPSFVAFSSISEVERDVGIAKETLRVWERRYGFPQPQRDANGERVYPPNQVQRLAQIKRLLNQGYRPGKIVALDLDALAELGSKAGPAVTRARQDGHDIGACIDLLKAHQIVELRQRLAQSMLSIGLLRCVTELIAPLTSAVGQAWADGKIAIYEEHLFSEMLQNVMRNAVYATTQHSAHAQARPRILLTTLPQERHGLGLLMVEALLSLEGAHCISLGVQTPLGDIVAAAVAQRADIVALSFSGITPARTAVDNINALRGRLGNQAEVWAGGAGIQAARHQLGPGSILDLASIATALAHWRARHAELAA